MDLEARGGLKNCAVANEYQQTIHAGARVIPLGIEVREIPFYYQPRLETDNLIYASKIHHLKGFDLACEVASRSGRGLTVAGENFGMSVPDWVEYEGHIADNSKLYSVLGAGYGLLATSRKDAGGRVILEASAVGTPVLTFDWTGCRCHVEHGVSGWICESVAEMVDAVQDLELINPKTAREWVADCHGLNVMIEGVEEALSEVAEGGGW
jgi:glycosyltransferase involved in cell wall biosynthesis